MATTAQKKRFGALILLALLGLVALVSLLIAHKVRDVKERYFARFKETVSGLEVGSTVKMLGVRVGQVETIAIADPENVILTLALEPDTPITEDTRAVMTSVGVTGLQFVELIGGSARSRRIPPDTPRSIIKAGASTFRQLMERSQSISAKLDALKLNISDLTAGENAARAARLKSSGLQLAATLGQLRSGHQTQLQRIFAQVDRTTAQTERASRAFERLWQQNSGRLQETLRAARAAGADLEAFPQSFDTRPAERGVDQALAATRQLAARTNVERAAAAMERSTDQLGTIGGELSGVLEQRYSQWREIKKNLDRAGLFLGELARRFGQ